MADKAIGLLYVAILVGAYVDLHFFLICAAVLVSYAAIRTAHGGLRLIIVFALALSLVRLGVGDLLLPASAGQPGQLALSGKAPPRTVIGAKLAALENNRCAMYVMENSPLGIFAYGMEIHKFLGEYHQLRTPLALDRASFDTVTFMIEDSFGPGTPRTEAADDHGQPPSLCGRVVGWAVEKTHLRGAATRTLPGRQ